MSVMLVVWLSLASGGLISIYVDYFMKSFPEFFSDTFLGLVLNVFCRLFALVYPFTLIAWYLIK